ncbi:RTA1-like protein [Artomyces pyxidatus]|uniref:RTA1-like protein n=1 Tax=Artomyces pyxidatus TaxID=48021 RepID=A0ACB8T4X6_9AGAM|nr:RTA1-like protein [Artomyces pyxidatus]
MAPTPPQLLASVVLAAALLAASPATAKVSGPTGPRPADPYADPKDDPYNPLGYITSNVLTTVALVLIIASFLVHAFNLLKWGAWWMSCMVIGEITFGLGIACRYRLHTDPESKNIYIAEYLLVVLSPCAFIAADYILLGRLATYLRGGDHLFVRPSRIRLLFLASDVSTFLIQALGGTVSLEANTAKVTALGNHLVLAGLILQLSSFCIFTGIFFRFVLRLRRYNPDVWEQDQGKPWYNDLRALVVALALSCLGIIVRSVYRVVENSQGFKGPLSRSEPLFYLLDTLPLWLAISVYAPFWPGRLMRPSSETDSAVDQVEMQVGWEDK